MEEHDMKYDFEEIDDLLDKINELYDKTELDTILNNKADLSDIPSTDSELSDNSENPVQNKTIYEALQNVYSLINALEARVAALEEA